MQSHAGPPSYVLQHSDTSQILSNILLEWFTTALSRNVHTRTPSLNHGVLEAPLYHRRIFPRCPIVRCTLAIAIPTLLGFKRWSSKRERKKLKRDRNVHERKGWIVALTKHSCLDWRQSVRGRWRIWWNRRESFKISNDFCFVEVVCAVHFCCGSFLRRICYR